MLIRDVSFLCPAMELFMLLAQLLLVTAEISHLTTSSLNDVIPFQSKNHRLLQ